MGRTQNRLGPVRPALSVLLAGWALPTAAQDTPAGGIALPTLEVPATTLIDAAIRYDFGRIAPGLTGTRLAVNASNLGDKRVVTSPTTPAACFSHDAPCWRR